MSGWRFALAALAISAFALVWNGLVHGLLLADAETELQLLMRPPSSRSLPLALLLTVAIAGLFVYAHAAWVRPANLKQSVGHGAFFGLLAGLLVDLNQFLLYPIPGSLALAWFGCGVVEFCGYGLLAYWLYRPRAAAKTKAI
ncbi:hypothetical protein NP603_16930 [Methylomonas sp. SURF-1]|uniref:Uncharacterized protein n=1 Tax=Methylomonas aurea TaxID=2952224 RepID=A0ABT1UMC4_9GAMM|nr:hypothetical protein [Methylomonas sp. SURF-1]MCQ8182810.1 hypothetical protein [Methylomonas sp. SURF-1]